MSALPTTQEGLAAFTAVIDVYEHRVGHACRALAAKIPSLITSFPSSGGTVLDNACGTGAASEEFLKVFPTAEIYAADVVPPMVMAFKAVVAAKTDLQRQVKDIRLENAQDLSFQDNMFDVSITNFGIFFFEDSSKAARQIYRTLKPGGTAVVSVWRKLGFTDILYAIQQEHKIQKPLKEMPLMESWFPKEKLSTTLTEAGFQKVEVHPLTVQLWGKDKEDFKTVLLENLGALTMVSWTDDERAKLPGYISKMVDERQEEFCISQNGRVGCNMDVWVATATK